MSENNVLVIFGATGDLTFQKLLPALNRLIEKQPQRLQQVILIGRQAKTLEDYLHYGDHHGLDRGKIPLVLSRMVYHFMQAAEPQQYATLKALLNDFTGRFFYLATPPSMFALITEALATSGCLEKQNPKHRCAYEKPFGENEVTASVLNDLLHEHLTEAQLYRVDHYLAKPLIQQILKIRMQWATLGMESLWQHPHLTHITVRAYETVGILSRGKFYDATGALKDMIQSHLLQMLALLVMDLPRRIDDIVEIQRLKTAIMPHLKPVDEAIRFGQYQGYLQEDHVNPGSLTETFVHLPLRILTPRWDGVKVILTTGKKLSEKRTEMVFHFQSGSYLTLHISPFVKVSYSEDFLTMLTPALRAHFLALSKHPFAQEDAYVTIFHDFTAGNQTLFPTSEEIIATWRLIDHIKKTPRLPIPYTHENDVFNPEGGSIYAKVS
jgi:glucose-6-phosphate 1-dehydrogenase